VKELVETEASERKISRKLLIAIIATGVLVLLALGALIWVVASRRPADGGGDAIAIVEPEPSIFATKVPTVSLYDERQAITVEQAEDEEWLLANSVELIPIDSLDTTRKVLMVGDEHPLDQLLGHEEVLSFTQTGVTALARGMIRRLNEVGGDATYFSEKIGPVLRGADVVHTSNEVSFTDNCQFTNSSTMIFCSPWAMMDAITDAGINLVELTGNHNNDYGAAASTASINKYHELGIATVGGGLNLEEARRPYEAKKKGSHVVMLAYNQADGVGSPALATASRAGANPFSYAQARADIEAAKLSGAFVIVNIQYWECWSYPERGTEMTACDYPIGGQQKLFRDLAEMGADMVVGSSAHQPQTFEVYKGVPIYYGLGNLWFDQSMWPGTARSLVLTHYFYQGRLLSTRIQPTVFGTELQVRLMETDAAENFLARLGRARPSDADKLTSRAAQDAVSDWVRNRDAGVVVYDLDNGRTVAEVNRDKKYFAASLYKIAVVRAGYQAVQEGQDAKAILVNGRTWGECLDAAIRTSDSPCAEALWARVGQDKATTNMSAADVLAELLRIWRSDEGADLECENRTKFFDSMLDQPELYRRGLPSGFGDGVMVWNKVGWNGNQEWHDAAIVGIDGRHYAVVVMSRGLVANGMGWSAMRELGELLDAALRN